MPCTRLCSPVAALLLAASAAAAPAPGSVAERSPTASAQAHTPSDPASRIDAARRALAADRPGEAADTLLSLVRDAVDAGDGDPRLNWLPAVVEPLRKVAEARRDAIAAERDRYAATSGSAALRAYATLNAVLDRDDLTLAWFDAAFPGGADGNGEPAAAAAARGAAQQLGPLLRSDRRFASMTLLWDDPVEEVRRRADAARTHLQRLPAAERDAATLPLLRGLAEVHAATLAADPAEPSAEAIADAVMASDLRPPAFAAAALAKAAEDFGVVNEGHLARLRSVPPGPPAPPWASGDGTATAPAGFAALRERIAFRLGWFPLNTLPAAADPDAWTARDRRSLEEAFQRTMLLGGLERIHGLAPNPQRPVDRWLAAAAAHAAWAKAWSGQQPPPNREGPPVPSRADLADLAAAAVAAGGPAADDPTLRSLAAVHLWYAGRGEGDDSLSVNALLAAADTGWHPFLRAFLLERVLTGRSGWGRRGVGRERLLERLVTLTAGSLAAPISAAGWRGRDDRSIRLATALYVFRRKGPLGVEWQVALAEELAAEQHIDPWIHAAFLGRHHVAVGWAARGFGTNASARANGYEVWERQLEAAEVLLRRATELEPGLVEPWVALIDVSKGGPNPAGAARRAFEGATAAELDHPDAWDRYLWSIGPLWGGDADTMRPLAVEAISTGRFDTGVPTMALRILRGIGGHSHRKMGWHLLDNPRDRAIVAGYEAARHHAAGLGFLPPLDASARAELVAMYARTREPTEALRQLEAAWEAGQTREIRRWLDSIDHDEQGLVWQEMTMLSGRHATALREAERLAREGRPLAATDALPDPEHAPDAAAFGSWLAVRRLGWELRSAGSDAEQSGRWSDPVDVPVGEALALNKIWMEPLEADREGTPRFRGMFHIHSGYQGMLLSPETLPALGGIDPGWAADLAIEAELSIEPRKDAPPDAQPPGVAVLVGAWYRPGGKHGGYAIGRTGDTLVIVDRFDGRRRDEIAAVALPPSGSAEGATPRTTLRVEREGGEVRVWVDGARVGESWQLPRDRAGRFGLTILDTEPGAVLRVHSLNVQRKRGQSGRRRDPAKGSCGATHRSPGHRSSAGSRQRRVASQLPGASSRT